MAVIVHLPHPVTHEGASTREAPAGTLLEVAEGERAWIDGRPWNGEPLGEHSVAVIRAGVAGDDDSDPLRTVLQIALIAAVSWLTLGAWGQAAAWWKVAAATTATIVGGNVVINALAPPSVADDPIGAAAPEPIYALTGGANRARPYRPLLLVFGTHRVFPDLASRPYVEFVGAPPAGASTVVIDPTGRQGRHLGINEVPTQAAPRVQGGSNDQYLNQIFHFGIGDLEVANLKIGDTALADLADVTTQWADAAGAIDLVSGDVETTAGGQLGFPDWVQRTTPAGTTRIDLDFVGALFAIDGSATVAHSAVVEIEIWPDGEEAKKTTFRETLRHDAPTPLRVTLKFDDLDAEKWQVRARMSAAAPDDDAKRQDVSWAAMRSFVPDAGDYRGQTRLAVRIRATGQLNGRVDRLSGDVSHKLPVWEVAPGATEAAWSAPKATSNPAWIFRAFALGIRAAGELAAGVGLPSARIDDDALKSWGAWCDANRLECNVVLGDRDMSHQQVLDLVARCGRAAVSWHGGKLGAVWDSANGLPVALFTPGNIVDGSVKVDWAGAGLADEVRAEFLNPRLDWQWDTVRRKVPGVASASRTAVIRLPGVTNARQAAEECNLQAARQIYHRGRFTWTTSAEGLAVKRGDVVQLTHGLAGGGIAGRCREVTSDGLLLDRRIRVPGPQPPSRQARVPQRRWDGADEPTIVLRMPQGDVHVSPVRYLRDPDDDANDADGDTRLVQLLDFPQPWTDYRRAHGALNVEPLDVLWRYYAADKPPRKFKVVSMRPTVDRLVELQARAEDARYYAAATADLTHALASASAPAPRIVSMHLSAAPAANGVAVTAALAVAGDWRGGEVTATYADGREFLAGRIEGGEAACSWVGPGAAWVDVRAVPGSRAAPAGAAAAKRWFVPAREDLMPTAGDVLGNQFLGIAAAARGGLPAPPPPPPAPRSVQLDAAVRLEWDSFPGALHDVRVRPVADAWADGHVKGRGLAESSLVVGPIAAPHVAALRRRNPAGESAWGPDGLPFGPGTDLVPELHVTPILDSAKPETVHAAWSEVGGASTYDVELRATAAEDISTNRIKLYGVMELHADLAPGWRVGVSASCRVRAVVGDAKGPWSPWRSTVVEEKVVDQPPPPPIIDTLSPGFSDIVLVVRGGADTARTDPPSAFEAQIKSGSSAWPSEWVRFGEDLDDLGGSRLAAAYRAGRLARELFSTTFTNLDSGSTYTCRVRAVNAAGATAPVEQSATTNVFQVAVEAYAVFQETRLPAPSANGAPHRGDIPFVAWAEAPWNPIWSAGTAFKAGDYARVIDDDVVRVVQVECATAHVSVAGGLAFSANALTGTQAANWIRPTASALPSLSDRFGQSQWVWQLSRERKSINDYPGTFAGGPDGYTKSFGIGTSAPTGNSWTWWLFGTRFYRRIGDDWIRLTCEPVLQHASTPGASNTAKQFALHFDTVHTVLWRQMGQGHRNNVWVPVVKAPYAAGAGVVNLTWKWATARSLAELERADAQFGMVLAAADVQAWSAGDRSAARYFVKVGSAWKRYDEANLANFCWDGPWREARLWASPRTTIYLPAPQVGVREDDLGGGPFWDVTVSPGAVFGAVWAMRYAWSIFDGTGAVIASLGSATGLMICDGRPAKYRVVATNGAGVSTTVEGAL